MSLPSTTKISDNGFYIFDAEVVKYYDPGHILLDLVDEEGDAFREVEETRKLVQEQTKFWDEHDNKPMEGRILRCGELRCVHIGNKWRPAIVTDFRYKDFKYELLLLDSGTIVENYKFYIRDFTDEFDLTCRYMLFVIMDLLPIGRKTSRYESWGAEACEDMGWLCKSATKIIVELMAIKKLKKYPQLFGNLHIHVNGNVIDVKKRLLSKNYAFEDPYLFRRTYHLNDEDCEVAKVHGISSGDRLKPASDVNDEEQFLTCRTYENVVKQPNVVDKIEDTTTCRIYENVVKQPNVVDKIEDITDETLDHYLPPGLKRGGAEALHVQERRKTCTRLNQERKIIFQSPPIHVFGDKKAVKERAKDCEFEGKEGSLEVHHIKRHHQIENSVRMKCGTNDKKTGRKELDNKSESNSPIKKLISDTFSVEEHKVHLLTDMSEQLKVLFK